MSATQFFGLLPTLTPHSFFLFMINGTIIQSSGHTRNLVFPLHASTARPCLCTTTYSPSLLNLLTCQPWNLFVLPSLHFCNHWLVKGNESALPIRWPKYWSLSFSISPSNKYSGLISFKIDWFDLAVQGTLKSLLQHHSSKASIHQSSAFFIVQLSPPYMATGNTKALTRQTFVGKVIYLLFNMLSPPGKPHSFFMKDQLDL